MLLAPRRRVGSVSRWVGHAVLWSSSWRGVVRGADVVIGVVLMMLGELVCSGTLHCCFHVLSVF